MYYTYVRLHGRVVGFVMYDIYDALLFRVFACDFASVVVGSCNVLLFFSSCGYIFQQRSVKD
jgi:hypothetical protein